MSTLSVPLPNDERSQMKYFISLGVSPNEAAFARQAIKEKLEREAVAAIKKAEEEPTLKGDLDTLAEQII